MIADDFKKASLHGDFPAEAWALVEVFGHRRHFGRISEIEQFGAKLLKIDVPRDEASAEFDTHFYGGASIFSLTPCTEEYARKANKRYNEPISLLEYASRDEPDDEDERPF